MDMEMAIRGICLAVRDLKWFFSPTRLPWVSTWVGTVRILPSDEPTTIQYFEQREHASQSQDCYICSMRSILLLSALLFFLYVSRTFGEDAKKGAIVRARLEVGQLVLPNGWFRWSITPKIGTCTYASGRRPFSFLCFSSMPRLKILVRWPPNAQDVSIVSTNYDGSKPIQRQTM